MNFKNLTDTELYLLRSTLRNADAALTCLFKSSVDPNSIAGMVYCDTENDGETSVSLCELEGLIIHVVCALNDEEDRRAKEC